MAGILSAIGLGWEIGSAIGGLFKGKKTATQAVNVQTQATGTANKKLKRTTKQGMKQLQFHHKIGRRGLARYNRANKKLQKIVFRPHLFKKTPAYRLGLREGRSGLENYLSRTGNLLSGTGLQALTKFNQDYAWAGHQKHMNNLMNYLSATEPLMNIGYRATAGRADLLKGYGGASSKLSQSLGPIRAQGTYDAYNSTMGNMGAIGQGIQGLAGYFKKPNTTKSSYSPSSSKSLSSYVNPATYRPASWGQQYQWLN